MGKNRMKNVGVEIPNVVNLLYLRVIIMTAVLLKNLISSSLAHSWYALAESTPYIPLGKE